MVKQKTWRVGGFVVKKTAEKYAAEVRKGGENAHVEIGEYVVIISKKITKKR